MKIAFWLLAAVAVLGGLMVGRTQATPAFKKEFDAKYVDKNSADPTAKAFAEAAGKANCLICHAAKPDGKQDTKVRNAYGQALDKLLDKNVKDATKIQKALDDIANEKSKPSDAASKTFGERIKEGKLPAAD